MSHYRSYSTLQSNTVECIPFGPSANDVVTMEGNLKNCAISFKAITLLINCSGPISLTWSVIPYNTIQMQRYNDSDNDNDDVSTVLYEYRRHTRDVSIQGRYVDVYVYVYVYVCYTYQIIKTSLMIYE
jgi:hypothetical protein